MNKNLKHNCGGQQTCHFLISKFASYWISCFSTSRPTQRWNQRIAAVLSIWTLLWLVNSDITVFHILFVCKQQSFGVWPLQFIAFRCFSVVGFWDNWHCGKCVGGEVIRKVGSHCLGGAIHLHGHATCKPAYSLSQETDWPELSQKHVTTVERNVNCTLACTCNYCREKKGPDSRPY